MTDALLVVLSVVSGASAAPVEAPALVQQAAYEGQVYSGSSWWVQRTTTVWGESGVGAEQWDLPRGYGVYVEAGPEYFEGIWWFYAAGIGWVRADDLGYEKYIPPPPPAAPRSVASAQHQGTQATARPSVPTAPPAPAPVAPPPQPQPQPAPKQPQQAGIKFTYYYCQGSGGDGGGWCGHFANGEKVTPSHSGKVAACGSNWKLGDYAGGYRCVDRGHLAPNQVDVFYYYSSEAR